MLLKRFFILGLLFGISAVNADTSTTTTTTTTVATSGSFSSNSGTCNLSTTPINFGIYNVFSNSPQDTVGQLTINCTGGGNNATYNISVQLNKGLNGSIPQRKLTQMNGNDSLSYNLYVDPSRSTIWGDGTGGSSVQNITLTGGVPVTLSIYGRIPQQQDVGMGGYSDVVTVTINY